MTGQEKALSAITPTTIKIQHSYKYTLQTYIDNDIFVAD